MKKFHVNFVLFFVFLDQLTKFVVRSRMFESQVIPLTSFFQLTYVTNTGVAFGMFKGANTFFAIFSFLVIGGFFIWFKKNSNLLSKSMTIALFLIISGAIGNLIDRVVRGSVIDFLEFHIHQYFWPAFNMADSCITVGGIILFIAVITEKKALHHAVSNEGES